MLVLTRRRGQKIVINGDITVEIVSGENGAYRVGIDAPKHISIDREEIYRKKQLTKYRIRAGAI